MFKFDFDIQDDPVEEKQAGVTESESTPDDRPFKQHTLEALVSES